MKGFTQGSYTDKECGYKPHDSTLFTVMQEGEAMLTIYLRYLRIVKVIIKTQSRMITCGSRSLMNDPELF